MVHEHDYGVDSVQSGCMSDKLSIQRLLPLLYCDRHNDVVAIPLGCPDCDAIENRGRVLGFETFIVSPF